MSLVENMKKFLEKKNSSSFVNNNKKAEAAVQGRSQVAVNKPQKRSAGRGK